MLKSTIDKAYALYLLIQNQILLENIGKFSAHFLSPSWSLSKINSKSRYYCHAVG